MSTPASGVLGKNDVFDHRLIDTVEKQGGFHFIYELIRVQLTAASGTVGSNYDSAIITRVPICGPADW